MREDLSWQEASGVVLDELLCGKDFERPERHQFACSLQIDVRRDKNVSSHAKDTVLPIV